MTPLEQATTYQRLGWQPIPIPHRAKKPILTGWQNFETVEADLPKHFNGKPQNIGVLLGAKSSGLTDIDLDSPEAVKLADYFLPPTKAEFGRASAPRSHREYICRDEYFEKFNNPFLISSPDKSVREEACICEFRGKAGLQTVFPGSTHESGESIEWHTDGEPLEVDAQTLRRAVALTASACLIATFWRNGIRNEINLALSGALLRNGFDLAATKNFIRAVCAAANDEEISGRLKAIDSTAQKIKSGGNVYGFPKLAELTDKKLVETICKWLQIESRQQDSEQAEIFASATNFIVTDAGVFHEITATAKDGKQKIETNFVCSKLEITAQTRDDCGSNWGRLLQWQDNDGREHNWAMPASLLSGDGNEVRARLLSDGLLISSQRKAQAFLSEYIQTYETFQKITCVPRIGWHNGAYILPNETITKNEAQGTIVFQSDSFAGEKLTTSGTLAEWQQHVARLCAGNSRLSFAVSCAFASVLLGILDEDGFGVHYRSPSSQGKTTTLLTAGSVFGGSRETGFLDSWKATDNSFEAVAETHNDGLLCLDEIGECDPFKVASIVYMLGNKTGKGRMNRGAALKKRYSWNVLFLSSGEMSLGDILTQTGQKVRGGQNVRLIDIEADAGKGLGLFETLHDFKTAHALADALRENSKQFYGAPIREFLRELVKKDFAGIKERWRVYRTSFLEAVLPENAGGEVKRVATKFALAAFAGEGASGVTGWNVGEASEACKTIFAAWLGNQSASAPSDAENAVKQVRVFLEAHGLSRFQETDNTEGVVINRVGFRRKVSGTDEIGEYLILPESFRTEVCKGFDPKFVACVLAERGYLQKSNDNKNLQNARLPGVGQTRVYIVNSGIFDTGGEKH
jgi:uncharacterized protein (DUF927 family)